MRQISVEPSTAAVAVARAPEPKISHRRTGELTADASQLKVA